MTKYTWYTTGFTIALFSSGFNFVFDGFRKWNFFAPHGLINAARGGVIDEEALVAALDRMTSKKRLVGIITPTKTKSLVAYTKGLKVEPICLFP